MPSFGASRYFCFHRDAVVWRVTIFMISPRCPSFETPRYFISLPRTLFQIYIGTLLFATNFFRSQNVTPLLCGGATSSASELKSCCRRPIRSSTALAKISCHLPRSSCPNLNPNFVSFTNFLFTPLNFVFFTRLFFLAESFYFICTYFAFGF